MIAGHWIIRIVAWCAAVSLGAVLSAGGLLRLDELFFESHEPNNAVPTAQNANQLQQSELVQETVYDRLVFVLVDALRADMVLGKQALYGVDETTDASSQDLSDFMPYTRDLVHSGQAIAYVSHAGVPTVTMPRLKALLTGRAPAFIDILKNFNSAQLEEENLLQLFQQNQFRLVFYGDDTWLKLFPSTFSRFETTSGFFTRDTVEVDTNVTRHLQEELDPQMKSPKSRDWEVLILHYLGVDHVGHLRGPRSDMMNDKLQEMDSVIQQIHESVRQQDAMRQGQRTLVLLCSDHGMSESGNHGGATVEETSAIMMFFSSQEAANQNPTKLWKDQRRRQVDLVPSLASLFGLRIPVLSTGMILDELLSVSMSTRQLIQSLSRNFLQLQQLEIIRFGDTPSVFDDAKLRRLYSQWLDTTLPDGTFENDLKELLIEGCRVLQSRVLTSNGDEYDNKKVINGQMILLVTFLIIIGEFVTSFGADGISLRDRADWLTAIVLVIGVVLQIASLASSSSIENEHATCFFLLTTLLVMLLLQQLDYWYRSGAKRTDSRVRSIVCLLVVLFLVRVLRARNQVINFARLNELVVNHTGPGQEFVDDDSLSILSTASLIGFVPVEVSFVVIFMAVVAKMGLAGCKNQSAISFYRAQLLPITLFVVGLVSCYQCVLLERINTSDPHAAKPWMNIDIVARGVYATYGLLWCIGWIMLAWCATSTDSLHCALVVQEMALWVMVVLLQRENNLSSLSVLATVLVLLQVAVSNGGQVNGPPNPLRSIEVHVVLTLWLGQSGFFALGNSHLVTTVDISQSYRGLNSYSQTLVGLFTFVNVFSAPLLCFWSLFQSTLTIIQPQNKEKANEGETRGQVDAESIRPTALVVLLLAYKCLRLLVYISIVFLMRFHLFIWSVFAPKLLYEVAELVLLLALVVVWIGVCLKAGTLL